MEAQEKFRLKAAFQRAKQIPVGEREEILRLLIGDAEEIDLERRA